MENIGEIKAAVTSFRSDTSFISLRNRWDKDYDLWRLKQYNAGSGYYSYTSNFPRVIANKIIAMIVMSKLLIRVPEELLTKEQRVIANNVERFLYGCEHFNDEKLRLIPDMPTVRAQKAWYAAIRGGFATRTYIYKDSKGNTIPEKRVYDLYNLAYIPSENGTLWSISTRKADREQVEKEYKVELKDRSKEVTVYEFCDEKKYGVFCNEKWLIELKDHGLEHNPVHIFKVGEAPPIQSDTYTDTGIHIGESIFASIRNVIPLLNKTLSDRLTLVRRGVKPPYIITTATGESNIQEDIWQVEKSAKIDLRIGESIEPLIPQAMPADTDNLIGWISGELQRATLSHTSLGELGFRLSGYAINQLQGTIETVLHPLIECITNSYLIESKELLEQYTKGKFKPIEVRGRTSKNTPFGYPTSLSIPASELEGDWHPEISLVPVLPRDDAQKLQLAALARRDKDDPLLSKRTVLSEYLEIPDVDLEVGQISLEWSDNLIINRLYAAYEQAVFEADEIRRANILAELKRLMAQQQPQKTTQAQPMPTELEGESMALPGAGAPPEETGLTANVMPPEQMGGFPGGAMNAKER